MALENMPIEPRGLFSGILQQGYALGYLLAAIINLFLVPAVGNDWRALFWFGSGLTFVVAVVRIIVPESPLYAAKKQAGAITRGATTRAFMKELRLMIISEYVRIIYAVLLMTGMVCELLNKSCVSPQKLILHTQKKKKKRFQLYVPWKSRSVPNLFAGHQRIFSTTSHHCYHPR
jgi:MFS family permease